MAAPPAALPSASPDDGWLCCLPLAHVGGLNVLMRALIGGAPVTVTHGFDEGEVDAAIATGRIAFTSLVPTTLARALDAGVDLARLQAVLVGGAALGEQLAERARREGVRVITTYGMTETCGGVVYDGVPFAGTEMRVEASGAIALRGPTLMRGYLRADDATRVAITPDGWFTTGDLGRLTPDGRLEVLGRADDAILSGGEIVMPEPVEEAIRTDHRVSDVAVVGIEDPAWGQRVVAFVIPTDVADPPSLEALRDAVAERLPRYAAPHDLVLVDRLPRTPSGKIRRRDLAHPAR